IEAQPAPAPAASTPRVIPIANGNAPARSAEVTIKEAKLPTLDQSVHARPPGFCTGCPERPIFTAMKLVERELGEHHISADI
ncbi:hypothetical protein, partial [Listeria monocytogenes]